MPSRDLFFGVFLFILIAYSSNTRRGLMTHNAWFYGFLMINPSPGRRQKNYMKQYWIIVNSNKLQWYLSQNAGNCMTKKKNLNLRLKWWSFYLRPLCVGLSRSRVSIRLNNSLWTGGAIWRHSSGSAAVQVMACKLDATKPYTESISRKKCVFNVCIDTWVCLSTDRPQKRLRMIYVHLLNQWFLIYDVDTPPRGYCSIYMRVITWEELMLSIHQMNLVSF